LTLLSYIKKTKQNIEMKKSILIIASLITGLFLASCSEAAETVANHADDAKEMVKEETNEAVEAVKEKIEEEVLDDEEVQVIQLEQTPGAFTTESLSLKAGKEYSFEVTNNADKQVAFVLIKAEDVEAAKEDFKSVMIVEAALPGTLEKGETGVSQKPVALEKGEYFYYCPLNGTPHYSVTVD